MSTRLRVLIALTAPLAMATSTRADPQLGGSYSMANGPTYVVRMQQDQRAQINDAAFKQYGYWGAEGAKSGRCLSSLGVARSGAAVRVPGKAFTDLCNVNSVYLSQRKGLFVLSLRGGDAADSFTAEFLFRGVYLIERMVRHGEFPEAYERTVYHYNTSNN